MAIEIKELRIKVTITEPTAMSLGNGSDYKPSPEKQQEWRAEIIRECTKAVFEKIKERAER